MWCSAVANGSGLGDGERDCILIDIGVCLEMIMDVCCLGLNRSPISISSPPYIYLLAQSYKPQHVRTYRSTADRYPHIVG